MNSKLLGVVAVFAMVACGDDTTSASGGTGGTGGSGGGTGAAGATGGSGGTGAAGATGGSGGGDLAACTEACNTLYDCGVEGMPQNCPGFSGDPAEKMAFVGAAGDGTCIDGCLDQPLLIMLVDGENCAMTITSISGVSPDFAGPCQDGFGGGGGGM